MRRAEYFKALISDENHLIFVIAPQDDEPIEGEAKILYCGGNNAFLYRKKGDVIMLDCLDDKIAENLANQNQAIILETVFETNEVKYDYIAKINP